MTLLMVDWYALEDEGLIKLLLPSLFLVEDESNLRTVPLKASKEAIFDLTGLLTLL